MTLWLVILLPESSDMLVVLITLHLNTPRNKHGWIEQKVNGWIEQKVNLSIVKYKA
jgi:hypothetical protein